jgi:hypothetical protein
MSSVMVDIEQAGLCLKVLKDRQPAHRQQLDLGKALTEADAIILKALFVQGVHLYARAVDTSAKGRSSLDIRRKLSLPLRPVHDKLIEFRNQFLAHY